MLSAGIDGRAKCLTHQPQYEPFNYIFDGAGVRKMDLQIYGTREFENGVIKHRPTKKYGKGIACSICEVSAYDVLMIPGRGFKRKLCLIAFILTGRSECPSNWIKEYSGYLMGSRYQIKQCVDKGMDTVLRNEFDIKDR